jgi:hypothetical protein
MITASEQAKTVYAFDRSATVTGITGIALTFLTMISKLWLRSSECCTCNLFLIPNIWIKAVQSPKFKSLPTNNRLNISDKKYCNVKPSSGDSTSSIKWIAVWTDFQHWGDLDTALLACLRSSHQHCNLLCTARIPLLRNDNDDRVIDGEDGGWSRTQLSAWLSGVYQELTASKLWIWLQKRRNYHHVLPENNSAHSLQ